MIIFNNILTLCNTHQTLCVDKIKLNTSYRFGLLIFINNNMINILRRYFFKFSCIK